MTYVDEPDKRQKGSKFEKRAKLLDIDFTKTQFQKTRKVSTNKTLIKSFGRIGMCLNNKPTESVPVDELDKVCFILCNTYKRDDLSLGIGPLNDAYMVGLNFHRFGFKIFYLRNPRSEEFLDYMKFFLNNTKETLVIYYSGRIISIPHTDPTRPNITAAVFDDGELHDEEIGAVLNENCNHKVKVILISDCRGGGSIWNIKSLTEDGEEKPDILTFSGKVDPDATANALNKTHKLHGVFTYYFCRLLNECPDITPERLSERINPPLNRFDESVMCQFTNDDVETTPILN